MNRYKTATPGIYSTTLPAKPRASSNGKGYATGHYGESKKLDRLDDAEIQNLIDQYQSQSTSRNLVGTGGKVYSGSAVLKLKLAQWRKRINP